MSLAEEKATTTMATENAESMSSQHEEHKNRIELVHADGKCVDKKISDGYCTYTNPFY